MIGLVFFRRRKDCGVDDLRVLGALRNVPSPDLVVPERDVHAAFAIVAWRRERCSKFDCASVRTDAIKECSSLT